MIQNKKIKIFFEFFYKFLSLYFFQFQMRNTSTLFGKLEFWEKRYAE